MFLLLPRGPGDGKDQGMPCIAREWLFSRPGLRVARFRCDGADGRRPSDERIEADRIWVVVRGRFSVRHPRFRQVADPTTAMLFRAGDAYEVRHPDGGDTCLSIAGAVATALVDTGPGARPLGVGAWSRLCGAAARLSLGDELAGLALEEALADALPVRAAVPDGRRDRDLADTIADLVRLRFDQRLPLVLLANEAGVSMFHACRVFRRMTGQSIHQYQLEVQLRHALSLLLDTRSELAEVAASTGFASQAHFTDRFRRRFGVTPGSVRTTRALHSLTA
jgi:AraC-like DNA-binding protein